MPDGEDLLKYITQRVITYIETPRSERKNNRIAKVKEPWDFKWFGLFGMALKMWMRKRRKR